MSVRNAPLNDFEMRLVREYLSLTDDPDGAHGCERCRRRMDPKFAQSHESICESLSDVCGDEIARLLAGTDLA